MSLRVWLPLTKDLRQQGLDSTTITQNSGTAISSGGKLGFCLAATSNATVVVNLPSLATMLANGKSYSLACWVKVTNKVTNGWVIKLGTNSCGLWWAASEARWVWNENDDGKRCANPTISSDTVNWHHLVTTITKSSNGNVTTARHYVDGKPATSYEVQTWDGSGNTQPAGTTITISPYVASLNDVRLYDHCLSPMEVKELSKGLVLHYPLNRQGWGQENLLLNTQVLTPNSSTSTKNCSQRGSSTRQLRSDGFYEAKCTSAWQGLSTWANAQNLVVGQKYTYSFYFYTNGSTKSLSFYPIMYNSSGTRDTSSTLPISVDGSTYQNANARAFGAFSNTIPIRHYVTFEWNSTMASIISNGGTIELSIQVHGTFNSGEYGCVYAPKLEIGDKMTPWCPNSSDALATTLGLNSTTEYDCSGFGNNGEYYAYDTNGSISYTSDTPKYNVSTHIASANPTQNAASGTRYLYGHCALTNPTQMSVAFWLKPITGGYGGTTSNGQGYFCTTNYEYGNTNAGSDYQASAMNHRDGAVNMNDSASTTQCNVTFYPTIGEWHYYVYTYDGQVGRGYKDGVQTATAQFSAAKTLDSFIGVVIGFSKAGGVWRRNDAYYSDFRIYATALSADDVKSLYQNSAYIDSSGNVYGAVHEED